MTNSHISSFADQLKNLVNYEQYPHKHSPSEVYLGNGQFGVEKPNDSNFKQTANDLFKSMGIDPNKVDWSSSAGKNDWLKDPIGTAEDFVSAAGSGLKDVFSADGMQTVVSTVGSFFLGSNWWLYIILAGVGGIILLIIILKIAK